MGGGAKKKGSGTGGGVVRKVKIKNGRNEGLLCWFRENFGPGVVFKKKKKKRQGKEK